MEKINIELTYEQAEKLLHLLKIIVNIAHDDNWFEVRKNISNKLKGE